MQLHKRKEISTQIAASIKKWVPLQKSKITRNFQDANQETSNEMMKKRRMHTSSSLTIPLNEGSVDAHFGKGA